MSKFVMILTLSLAVNEKYRKCKNFKNYFCIFFHVQIVKALFFQFEEKLFQHFIVDGLSATPPP